MKTVKVILIMILVTAIATIFLQSCDKEEDPKLNVISIMTDGGVDLNTSAMTDGVPLNSAFIVTFDNDINATTADVSSISIFDNDIAVPVAINVEGSIIRLTPSSILKTGNRYTLSIKPTLSAGNGASASLKEVDFETYGFAVGVTPQNDKQLSHFTFNGSISDAIGNHTPTAADVRDITYATDRFGFAGLAADFNGTSSIVEIPNGDLYMLDNNSTVSVWIKANGTKDGQYILGLGAWKGFHLEMAADWTWVNFVTQYATASISDAEDNKFTGLGDTKDNGGWQGILFNKPLADSVGKFYFKDKWAHVVSTYDATTKIATLYLNGEKVRQTNFNLWPVDDAKRTTTGVTFAGNLTDGGNKLALGFIQGSQNRIIPAIWADPANIYSYHFKGQMDDLRIYKTALSETEVATLHSIEKPQ